MASGSQAAQGLVFTESYYWDLNDRTREFGERFFKRTGRMPNMVQAGMYSATLQYLKAVKAAGHEGLRRGGQEAQGASSR